jgi:hypothetical protein
MKPQNKIRSMKNKGRLTWAALAGVAALCAATVTTTDANAQEVQITGPLAGAPAYRKLRLHRKGRFDIGIAPQFTLLDEFRRHVLLGARATYHFKDWLGVGLWGGGGISYNTGLSDELQEKAVNGRNCAQNPESLACRRTAVNLCKGDNCLDEKQLGRIVWMVSPQVTVVPFRGKFSLFGKLFLDADISIFAGAAIVGLQERQNCGPEEDVKVCGDAAAFELSSRVTAAPTFGLGFNFYPMRANGKNWMSFGAEFRAVPFAWNPSGFDISGANEGQPDNAVNADDRALSVNPMLSAFVAFQLPTKIKLSD